jgi:hypothetical protein
MMVVEFRRIWLWRTAMSAAVVIAFLFGLAGLDVGLVDEAIVEEKVVKAVVEEEVVEACGLERVGVDVAGVVAGSQILSVGGGAEKLQGCPCESRQGLGVLLRRLEQPGAILLGEVDCGEGSGRSLHCSMMMI